MQGIHELDIVSGSGVGHGTPAFDALSERRNYRRDSQSTVAGPPGCASVALRRRLTFKQLPLFAFMAVLAKGFATMNFASSQLIGPVYYGGNFHIYLQEWNLAQL